MTAGDSFITVCLTDEDVDKLTSHGNTELLLTKQPEAIVPPHLRARQTIVAKRLEPDQYSAEILDQLSPNGLKTFITQLMFLMVRGSDTHGC